MKPGVYLLCAWNWFEAIQPERMWNESDVILSNEHVFRSCITFQHTLLRFPISLFFISFFIFLLSRVSQPWRCWHLGWIILRCEELPCAVCRPATYLLPVASPPPVVHMSPDIALYPLRGKIITASENHWGRWKEKRSADWAPRALQTLKTGEMKRKPAKENEKRADGEVGEGIGEYSVPETKWRNCHRKEGVTVCVKCCCSVDHLRWRLPF